MIILKNIKLNNFLSHTNTDIELNQEQKLLLDGNSGSGKSSVVEAVIWGLYGKGRVDNKSLIKKNKKTASVIITLTDNEDDSVLYKITRSIDSKGKQTVEVDETNDKGEYKPIKAAGVKEVQSYLEKNILKSSYLLFINSIAYPQENNEAFVKQTAKKRKDIIMEMIQSEDYDDYLKIAKNKLSSTKTNLEVLKTRIENKKEKIAEIKDVADELEDYKQKEKEYEEKLKKINKELEDLKKEESNKQEELSNLNSRREASDNLSKKIQDNYNIINELNEKIKNIETIDIDSLKKNVERLRKVETQLQEQNNKKNNYLKWLEKYNLISNQKPIREMDFESREEELNRKIIDKMKEEVPTCHNCGTVYPKFEEEKKNKIDELSKELEDVSNKKSGYNQKLEEYNKQVEEIQKEKPEYDDSLISSLENEKNSLSDSERKLYEAQNNLNLLEQLKKQLDEKQKENEEDERELKSNQKILEKEDKVKSEKEEKEREVQDKEREKEKIQENKSEQSFWKEQAEENKKRIEEYTKELKELENKVDSTNYDIKALETAREAFRPNGIRTIVIDYVIPQLEERINNILEKLSDFRVKLETQKEGVSEGTVLEGLFISIINDVGEEFDFSSYSGGEKVKISLAINEALAEISKINFRVMDEAIVALDNESTYQFVESLSDIQSKVNQIICVSHLPEIKEMFEDRILFKKIRGDTVKE